jgi:hypothetical protein
MAFPEELQLLSLSRNSQFLWNPKVPHGNREARHWTMSCASWIHSTPSHQISLRSILSWWPIKKRTYTRASNGFKFLNVVWGGGFKYRLQWVSDCPYQLYLVIFLAVCSKRLPRHFWWDWESHWYQCVWNDKCLRNLLNITADSGICEI